MVNNLRFLTLCFCVGGLVACANNIDQNAYVKHTSYQYQPYVYENTRFYSESYNGGANYGSLSQSQKEVSVPDSYHVGAYHSPTSHKDLDRNWVNRQNPEGYTIELGDSDKAAQVAGRLYKAPKSNRMAEIKYSYHGKSYYKGVYGSYSTYEEAQKAYNNLPKDIKHGAGISNWSKVQTNLRDDDGRY